MSARRSLATSGGLSVSAPRTTWRRPAPPGARDGARSARFELRDGDLEGGAERQQLADMMNPDGTSFRPKEGDEYYVATSHWFEAPFPGLEGSFSWNVFFAWTSFDARGSGPLKLAHGGANGRLANEGVNDQDPLGGYYWMNDKATVTGGWHDFVMRIKFSQNPAVGFLELWHREPGEAGYTQQTFIGGGTPQVLLNTAGYRGVREGGAVPRGRVHADGRDVHGPDKGRHHVRVGGDLVRSTMPLVSISEWTPSRAPALSCTSEQTAFGIAPMPTCRQLPSSTSAAISCATAQSASVGGGFGIAGAGPSSPAIM